MGFVEVISRLKINNEVAGGKGYSLHFPNSGDNIQKDDYAWHSEERGMDHTLKKPKLIFSAEY